MKAHIDPEGAFIGKKSSSKMNDELDARKGYLTPRHMAHLSSAQFASLILAPKNSATLPRGDNKTGEIPKQGGATSPGG